MAQALPLEFGGFRLDPQRRTLSRLDDGRALPATPRLIELLLALIERAPEVVSREELMARVWPGVVVEDNNLSQQLSALRRLLGDEAEQPRYIQTVPRRGLRFVAELKPVAEPPEPVPEPTAEPSSRRGMLLAASAAVVTTLGGLGWVAGHRTPEGASHIRSLAVLPFKPLVENAADPALELGMADALITRLGQLRDLRVTAIGSAARYGGLKQDPLAAAEALGTDAVLEGTLQRQGERLRVNTRLLRRDGGLTLWSASFDEQATDLFGVQERIAHRVADSLQRDLGLALQATGRGGQAHELYMAGRLHAATIRPDAMRKAVSLYERAVALDPDHALAIAHLGFIHRILPFAVDFPPKQAFGIAQRYAQRAMALEPRLAEPVITLGYVKFWHEFDWPAAEALFRRGIELNPSLPEGYRGLGHLFHNLNQQERAVEQLQRTRELDPFSAPTLFLLSGFLLHLNRLEEAQHYADRAIDLDPQSWNAQLAQSTMAGARGDIAKETSAMRRAVELSGTSYAKGSLGYLLAQQGQKDEARALLAELQAKAQAGRALPTMVGLIHLGLGDEDAAMQWLLKARDAADPRLSFLRVDKRWWPLRKRADFMQLYEGMKLPPLPAA